MVVSGWQPIGQNTMEYVPAGGSCDLPVTVAPDIKGTAREEEVARKTVRTGPLIPESLWNFME